MKNEEIKLEWIQALRGIAAMMVVLVHSRFILQGTDAGKQVADTILYPLAMGVDLFFLISGFLMVLTTQNFEASTGYAWRFLAKRIARIWPLYVIVSVAALAIEHHGLHGFRDPAVVLYFMEGIAFVPHNPTASPLYFLMAVNVAWTLCFEFYFYTVFAGSMLFGKRRYLMMAIWFVITLLAIPIFRGNFNLSVSDQAAFNWSRYGSLVINPIIWDFILGMIAASIYRSKIIIHSRILIYVLMTTIIAFLIIEWTGLHMINFHGPKGWAAPLSILFLGIVMLAKLGEIKVPAWSIWLGEISYSLYLVHLYVFAAIEKIIGRFLTADNATTYFFVLRPIFAVAIAGLVYRYIETPASLWLRNALLKPHPKAQQKSASLSMKRD